MKVTFEHFVLDTDLAELSQAGVVVAIEPQVFDLLRFLIENRERVVTKDEIVERIWDGRFVSDAAISSCVKALRKALGDDGEQQRLVRTVRGRGFRFVGAVKEPAAPQEAHPASEMETPVAPTPSHKPSVIVLPFQSLMPEGPEQILSEAVPHELIQALSRLR
ncbi:MAG: winged helix-turn-helix domain-containing protein, partial [Pseudomonadota bacterium]